MFGHEKRTLGYNFYRISGNGHYSLGTSRNNLDYGNATAQTFWQIRWPICSYHRDSASYCCLGKHMAVDMARSCIVQRKFGRVSARIMTKEEWKFRANFIHCTHHRNTIFRKWVGYILNLATYFIFRKSKIDIWFALNYHLCCSRLRHCTTSRKVEGSIPDGTFEISYWLNPFGRTMPLGLTQPLTQMLEAESTPQLTRNISFGVKAAGAWGWQRCHLHVPI